ncbi:MAG TPA: tandem-95 repeat protein [Mycobacteriales bacterium]|nr:tandem-95 repeat protein [Mycobacteriales bacterium]
MSAGRLRVLASAGTIAVIAAAVVVAPSVAGASGAGEGSSRAWPYWRADLHAHSVTSGDATVDPGVVAQGAKAGGFNAVFLTDHQAASYNTIGGVIASHVSFEDDSGANRQWDDVPSAPTATASGGLSTERVLNGINSYKTAVSATGEAFGWIKRGPNLRSGQITMTFSVFPTRVDPGTGLYVSASLGGDPSIPSRTPDGYTTAAGTVQPGQSTVLVWQLGDPRVTADDGTNRTITRSLDYTLNTWNTYTVDVTSAIASAFPNPSTRPSELNALLYIKMAAGSRSGGSAAGYFDTFRMDAANAPTKSADAALAAAADFVARNQVIHTWDTPTFLLEPGQEMGFNDHAQRLHFPISDVSQWQQFPKGVEGISAVQASGFPAQLNHPGLPGGVTDDEAILNSAYGADVMEAVERGTNDIMIRDWDALLHNGEPLIGTWTSDSHRNATFGPATFLQAPALDELGLQHSLFEGRAFLAPVSFPGRVSFTPDGNGGSYPARYPLYRSSADGLGSVHLAITDGLVAGSRVLWLRDGAVVRSDDVTGPSYDGSLILSLPATSTPVRAEVRRPDGSRALMTEPIMMRTASGLPYGVRAHLERVSTPSGAGYTKTMVKGVTGLAYDAQTNVLTTTLQNPAGSTVLEVIGTGSYQPASVTIDGSSVPAATSRTALEAGSSDGWAYDSAQHELVVKATHAGATGTLRVGLTPGPDTSAPTVPQPTALAEDAFHVNLQWPASQDDTGVAQYLISRNGTPITAVPGTSLSYVDSTVTADTPYTYSVQAQDAAQNLSAAGTVSVRTPKTVTTVLAPVADTYASSQSPNSNYGKMTKIKADASPETNIYLRFTLPSAIGPVLSASVTVTSTAALPGGVRYRALTDHSWGESTLNFTNAPALGAVVGTGGAMAGGTANTTDITAYVKGGGSSVDLGLSNPSGTNVSIYARESNTGGPRLTLVTSAIAPQAGDLTLTTPEDVSATFTPSVGGGSGPLTCSIDTPPASGSVWVAPDCSSGTLTPAKDFVGTGSFKYAASDGSQRAVGTVAFTTTAVNDVPTTDAEELGAGTDEDTPVTVTLRGNDVDGDCPLSFSVLSGPQHGALGSLSSPSCATGAATATVTYTPASNFSGSDSFTYQVRDPSSGASVPATLDVSVAAVNDPPVAGTVSISAAAGQSVSWTPVVSDVDSASLTCAIATSPGLGSATVASGCASGTYTAPSSGTGTDAFTYSVTDGTSARTGTVNVTFGGAPPTNQAPTATGSSLDTAQRSQVLVQLSGSDPEGACPMTFAIANGPSHGTLGSLATPTCSAGSGASSVTYTPTSGYAGPDSFTFTVSDAQGLASAPATVSITVTPPAGTGPLFSDGFESGLLSAWSASVGVTVVTTTPRTGTFDAQLDMSAGGPSYLRATLGCTCTSTEASTGVRVVTLPSSGTTSLLRLRGADSVALLTALVDSTGKLKLRNEITKVTWSSSTVLPAASWAVLSMKVTTAGANSTVQVLLNGVVVPGLSVTTDLGAARVATVQLGDNVKGPTGKFLVDDVTVTGS